MNRRRVFGWSLALFALMLLGAEESYAQTTAVGPYYAMPSWDQKLTCASASNCPRFIVLSNWNNEAVLDRETGIVWERSPKQQFPFDEAENLPSAHRACVSKNTGGRRGWRLPTLEELHSLIDVNAPDLALPPGHPFQNVRPGNSLDDYYWSATRVPFVFSTTPPSSYAVSFRPPASDLTPTHDFVFFYWCVRGPGGPTS
jgi:hypothetical protein